MKRVVVLSDGQCGADGGLTPPLWHGTDKHSKIRRDCWRMYEYDLVKKLKPVHTLICNGDMIEGPENPCFSITVDRTQQTAMAVKAIKMWDAEKIIVVEGTPYHTGKKESWEELIAKDVGAVKFGAHVFVNVNGLILDCKHFVGGTSVPRHIPPGLTREAAWNKLKAEVHDEPEADVIIRSHIHTCLGGSKFFDDEREVHFVTTPGLQAYSNHGCLKVSRQIHWGLIYFDVEDRDNWRMHRKIMTIKAQQAKAVIV